MSIHHLKINKQPFYDLVSGRKTGEVRDCSDRDFKVGDSVELFMTETATGLATESIVRTITHIQRGYGLPDDICVLSYAAPVVEHQPVALPPKKYPRDWNKKALSTANMEYMDAYNDAIDDVAKLGPLYTAPPELAELQATIARLTAENERLKLLCRDAAHYLSPAIISHQFNMTDETRKDALRVCHEINRLGQPNNLIERLKGGQGYPVPIGNLYRAAEDQLEVELIGNPKITDGMQLFASQPAPVSVVMSFDFEHPLSKEKRTVTLTKQDVLDGMEDYFYDKLGEQICQCESVGETNVVDCNCDEYVHDFEIVTACLDKVKELNQSLVIAVDPGKPGSDMTAKATFTREDGKLTLERVEHSEPGQWTPDDRAEIAARERSPLKFNQIGSNEPPCSFCFQRGCNGECHGDDMMGGGD